MGAAWYDGRSADVNASNVDGAYDDAWVSAYLATRPTNSNGSHADDADDGIWVSANASASKTSKNKDRTTKLCV